MVLRMRHGQRAQRAPALGPAGQVSTHMQHIPGLLQPCRASVGAGLTHYPGVFGNKKQGIASRNIETPNDVLWGPPANTKLNVFIITELQERLFLWDQPYTG